MEPTRTLSEMISEIWRVGNKMPTARPSNQSTDRKREPSLIANGTIPHGGDILDGGVWASKLNTSKITAAIYGRNGSGKTTFACQGDGPIALISVEPAPTGGARSIMNRSDVRVYQVTSRYLTNEGKLETVRGTEKMLAIAESLKRRFAAGQCPFRKVVIDGLTSWSEVILGEVLGMEWEAMPAILSWGKVTQDQYTERGERLMRCLRPFLDLPCDLWLIAQERDHNPPKKADNKGRERVIQSKLMADAHPSAQEGSFYSLAIGDTPAKFVQDSCDFVMQLYEDNEWREEKSPDVIFNGQTIPGTTQMVPTGRRVKRLRCIYHPNYAARVRSSNYRNVPEYIEAPTPEERYQAFLDVVAGKRTKFGYYPAT